VDFFLFRRLESIMEDESYADVAAIQERVTAVLRSIPKEAFADSFQKLRNNNKIFHLHKFPEQKRF
jgi:fido (protein-threonine AMPylation protein)